MGTFRWVISIFSIISTWCPGASSAIISTFLYYFHLGFFLQEYEVECFTWVFRDSNIYVHVWENTDEIYFVIIVLYKYFLYDVRNKQTIFQKKFLTISRSDNFTFSLMTVFISCNLIGYEIITLLSLKSSTAIVQV